MVECNRYEESDSESWHGPYEEEKNQLPHAERAQAMPQHVRTGNTFACQDWRVLIESVEFRLDDLDKLDESRHRHAQLEWHREQVRQNRAKAEERQERKLFKCVVGLDVIPEDKKEPEHSEEDVSCAIQPDALVSHRDQPALPIPRFDSIKSEKIDESPKMADVINPYATEQLVEPVNDLLNMPDESDSEDSQEYFTAREAIEEGEEELAGANDQPIPALAIAEPPVGEQGVPNLQPPPLQAAGVEVEQGAMQDNIEPLPAEQLEQPAEQEDEPNPPLPTLSDEGIDGLLEGAQDQENDREDLMARPGVGVQPFGQNQASRLLFKQAKSEVGKPTLFKRLD